MTDDDREFIEKMRAISTTQFGRFYRVDGARLLAIIESLQPKEGYVMVNVKYIMAIRYALVQDDYQEAYHQLYQIANDQAADKYHPWAEFEAMIPAADRIEGIE